MVLLAGFIPAAPAVDWYVATNGTGLGTNGWADATNSLQGAINMASTSTYDVVWVSNGVYNSGGVTNYPAGSILTSRIVIAKSITVRSRDNNPTNTVINGNWDPNTNGPAAVRCVYMASNSVLIGFTLTNGATMTSGTADRCGAGVYCPGTRSPVISNCIITGNSAYGANMEQYGGGGAWYGTLYNCSLIGNRANSPIVYAIGGGANYSVLSNCTLIGNYAARNGGGVANSILYDCTLISNSCAAYGSGAMQSTLQYCTLTGNSGGSEGGGGVYGCSLVSNCKLINNRAGASGGAGNSTLYNCLLAGNSASAWNVVGGAQGSTLYNCTVTSNRTDNTGPGGVSGCILSNCIVYLNSSGSGVLSNWSSGTFAYSCTLPAPDAGVGNITNDPMFVNKNISDYRLSARSPCINAGTNGIWTTTYPLDLEGRQRVRYGTVDMGAYENIRSGSIYGFR